MRMFQFFKIFIYLSTVKFLYNYQFIGYSKRMIFHKKFLFYFVKSLAILNNINIFISFI